jgi:DNA-directed RNA polymerase subunit K/omega
MDYNKFEKARIIGSRAFQLALNAKPNVVVSPSEEVLDVASKEFYEGKVPLRPLGKDKEK